MFRRWLAANRSLAVTATSGTVIAALIAGLAVFSGGYEAQKVDLGDGSVWVANGSRQVIGRANTEILALDTVVDTAGTDLEVLQSGRTVLVVDRTNARLDIVDPATAESSESVPLPADAPEVFLTGSTAVIRSAGTGETWIVPIADLGDFDAESEPSLSLGADSVASVSPGGTMFVFSNSADEVYRVDLAAGRTVAETYPADFGDPGDIVGITSVGDSWALLDGDGRLFVDGRMLELADIAGSGDGAVLQVAADSGDRVLVAHSAGLIAVPVDGGDVAALLEGTADGIDGVPVRPVTVDGCAFAAYSNGAAWRQCDGATENRMNLEGTAGDAATTGFVVSGTRVVLNDAGTGATWAVQRDGEAIDNWDELIAEDEDQQEVEENSLDTPPELEKNQLPPVATDDDLGARADRASVLPVLLNDYDPNGDSLTIESVDGLDSEIGRLDVIDARQRILITLEPAATGTVSFGYTISDGRGGTAAATVTVTVRGPDENSAPVQVRRTQAVVAQGGRVSTPVLGDWIDPDGDAVYLAEATAIAPDQVTYKPGGTVDFQEGGGDQGTRPVTITVSDGRASGAGQLAVTVRGVGDVPPVADPFVVVATAGREVTVRPLEHVRGGSGPIRLSSVPAKPGAVIEASLETGTFRFTSDQVRTHLLEYVVNDGDETATGTIRIEVTAPPEANSTPITIPKTVFVKSLGSETVDVAGSDIDPAGGVLLVSRLDELPAGTGVRADVLEQRSVRVTLTAPLDAGPVSLGYRVTNGLAGADGTITVVEIPRPDRLQPPVATDDSVTVRPGDAIDIRVLANDTHPDGEQLVLSPTLATPLGRDSGLLFASGSVLRYLAPDTTGNFTASYEISGPDGQVAQAQLNIAVREAIAATNAAPAPTPVVARVIAGETVRIRIPLTGIDPDGDSVQLLGQDTNPDKGSVSEVGADYLDYLAGDYSAGTDTFSYVVIDALGARATGTVRVGISPRTEGARSPVAVEDEVRVRPGKTVSVRPLANDSDPDGSALRIVEVDPNTPDIAFSIEEEIVEITPPEAEGRYGLVYTIENSLGGRSSNFITVIVDGDAPPSLPIASDTVLTLSDILDRDEVTVDVLRGVFFADGPVSSLRLELLPGFGDTASVTANKRVTVQVGNARQIIPFSVTNPDDPSVVAYAFIWVPGLDDALPQLDRTARPLVVASESELRIDLNDYVIAVRGREVRLADSTSVTATHANTDSLVIDSQTLRFTSADAYFGPASISFDVTDGVTATDPDGRRATIVLPIRVTPRENQPPVFSGGVIEVEPGEETTLDLVRLTTYPYPDDLDELAFSVTSAPPAGFDYSITGSTLVVRAPENAARGSSAGLTIAVRDGIAEGRAGRIQLSVVASTRPLASPAADAVIAPRGTTTSVDVLANDQAANPFPGRPLSVVAIRGLDGAALPAGVSVTVGENRSRLSVTVAADAAPIDTNLQYQVADATGDPSRYTFGSIRISVQDRPDAPVAPARAGSGYEAGRLTIRLTPPLANNSPITGYEVLSSSNGEYRMDCGTQLLCELTGLTPGLQYRFTVVAVNAVGRSDASGQSVSLSTDFVPAAPGSVGAVATAANPAGAAIQVSWSAVPDPNPGSAVTGYTVRITGPDVDFSADVARGATSLVTTAGGTLLPDRRYVATVYARNSAFVAGDGDWRATSSSPVTTIGPPGSPAGGVSAAVIGTEGDIRVTWGASSPNGAAGVSYSVGRLTAGSSVPTSCSVDGGNPGVSAGAARPATSGWVDTNTSDGADYRYVVYAVNSLFCTPTASGAVESKVPPGTAVAATSLQANGGQFDVRVGSLSAPGTVQRFQANTGGAWFDVAEGQWLTSIANASVYGTAQSATFRACRDEGVDFCGAASAPLTLTPVNARADILSCQIGRVPQANPPQNAGSPAVQYLYSFEDGSPDGSWSEFEENQVAPEPFPLGTGVTSVRLKAVVTLDGASRYVDPGFDEDTCEP